MRRRKILLTAWILLAIVCFAGQGWGLDYTVGDRPLTVNGFVNQSVYYGIRGDSHYETKGGFNSFLTQALIEGTYLPTDNTKMFLSGSLNADWAYPLLSHNSSWQEKDFDKSRSRLFIFDDWQDVVKEAHYTWTHDKFYLRAGKQIVQWGETDGFLLTNLINPVDQRRGPGDVKFENNILPIWLVRAEYNTPVESTFLKEFGAQFILDPNFQWRGNQVIMPGNDYMGAWAPKVDFNIGGKYPFDYGHVGSFNVDYDKRQDLNPNGMTYGLKLKGDVLDTVVSLLGYYGRDRDFVLTDKPSITTLSRTNPWDQRMVVHPGYSAYFPYLKFVGATVTKDLHWLKASFLGGVSPVLRVEALYAFNSSFSVMNKTTGAIPRVAETDEFRGMMGFDWKVKIPFLNESAFFLISPQYFYQRMMDYPSGNVSLVQRSSVAPIPLFTDNHMSSLMIMTNYFHTKVTPMFFWLKHWSQEFEMYKAQVSYEPTEKWIYTVGAISFYGKKKGVGMETFENKDQMFATVGFRF